MNLGLENLEHLLKMESNKPVILTRTIATHISKVSFHSACKLNQQFFRFSKQNLTLIFKIKTSIFILRVQYQMETLKENFNNLVLKTLEMDQIETLQSQPTYESENEIESQQDQTEKNQNSSKSDIVSRHSIKYSATRIKYSPTRIKSRNFLSNISYTALIKKTFIIKILS